MFHIVLVEPQIAPNTGNVIRLCANSGATLHLVQPLGFRLEDKKLARSGLDYHDLAEVRVHAHLDAALAALEGARHFCIETGAPRRYDEERYRAGDAFLFGSETRGLPAALLARLGAERTLHIPMRAGNRSLNLANAVAVVSFEAWRQLDFSGAQNMSGNYFHEGFT